MTKLVLIDLYGDSEDLLLVDDHDGKLGDFLDEWRDLDRRMVDGEDCDWMAISIWLIKHGYPPIEFEEVAL